MQSEPDSSASPGYSPSTNYGIRSPGYCPPSPDYEIIDLTNDPESPKPESPKSENDQLQARSISIEEWKAQTRGGQSKPLTYSPQSPNPEVIDLTNGEETSPAYSLVSPKQEKPETDSESSDDSIFIVYIQRKKPMTEHFLIDPNNLRYRIFAQKTSNIVTVIGTEPNRSYPSQRKPVLYDQTLEKTHCAIRTTPGSSQLKSLTETGILRINSEPVIFKSAVAIKDHDVLTIGATNYLYRIITQRRKINRIKPVSNIERYLKEIKKNPNYKAPNIVLRK